MKREQDDLLSALHKFGFGGAQTTHSTLPDERVVKGVMAHGGSKSISHQALNGMHFSRGPLFQAFADLSSGFF